MISGSAAVVVAVVVTGLWIVSVRIRDASIVDIFWGPGFGLIALVCGVAGEARGLQWGLVALVGVWGVRLGVHLARRNLGKGEDPRYRAMRERVGAKFSLVSLVSVFWLQGTVMFVISIPIQAALLLEQPSPRVVPLVIGLACWVVGFAFESIGDAQLARFKADPRNAGAVLDRGLWRYTRHPNYFGDSLVWFGHYGVAVAIGAPWWTIFSPLLMTFLLTRVSGVPLLEAGLARTRPGYAEYVRRTSSFVPRRPKD